MRATIGFAALLACVAAPAAAQGGDINADVFYRDAKELLSKGMRAMFDKRTRPMMASMKSAGLAAKAENDAATRAGKPIYCVPAAAHGKGLSPQAAIDKIGRIPEPQRKAMTLRQAWRIALVRDYPCS